MTSGRVESGHWESEKGGARKITTEGKSGTKEGNRGHEKHKGKEFCQLSSKKEYNYTVQRISIHCHSNYIRRIVKLLQGQKETVENQEEWTIDEMQIHKLNLFEKFYD